MIEDDTEIEYLTYRTYTIVSDQWGGADIWHGPDWIAVTYGADRDSAVRRAKQEVDLRHDT